MNMASGMNAQLAGLPGAPVLVFVHGFGCGQAMWRHVAPAFQRTFRTLLLDLPGSGDADPRTYDPDRHSSLDGYADDVLAALEDLDLRDVTIVGHSVASMIAVLAHVAAPAVVSRLVLVAPSSRYIDEDGYRGGFSAADIDDLLAMMERNHLGWQNPLSGLVAGPGHESARAELEESFCRAQPEHALQFAEVTFRGDNRADLDDVRAPTLVLQVRHDTIAPLSAGMFIHEHIAGSSLRLLESSGHAPHVTDPDDVIAAMAEFLGDPAPR